MSNRRNVRRKRALSEEEEEEEDEGLSVRDRLEATRELQRGRQRTQGIASDNLSGGAAEDQGGVRDEGQVIGGYVKEQKKAADTQIDVERERYIKEQLDKRFGRTETAKEQEKSMAKDYKDSLYAIPKALQAQQVEQEDVSAWMTGIVEVPLSLEQQLKNIEATELAKKQLLNSRDSLDANPSSESTLNQDLRRISYPLRFGKQTGKEEAWRQEVLQRGQQPKDWKRNRRS